MKIEIAENLIYCYLKHVAGCRIVQTNWKTSSTWKVTEMDDKRARELFDKVKESPSFKDIFKNNSFNQLIKQAEIDILGLNSDENSIYGIDIAFHSAGINYGDSQETASRIMKKIFRTVFVMQSYFSDVNKFYSYFVTPKVNPSTRSLIDPLISEAKTLIDDENINIEFIANDEFYESFVDPISSDFIEDNDTMELFARALKLVQLDPRSKSVSIKKDFPSRIQHNISDARTEDGMKIGKFVKDNISRLFENNLLSAQDIQNLQNKDYCKQFLNQTIEVLRHKNLPTTDSFGNPRFYANKLYGDNYHLNSQWYERHWEPFKSWLRMIER